MLNEMRYIESELLPMLRERADKHEESARRQLRQWRGEKGVMNLLLHVAGTPEAARLPDYDQYEIHYDDEKMFVSQLKAALSSALADGDAVPSVRANVGCGAINTLLGGLKQTFFTDKMPWLLEHLSVEDITELSEEAICESEEFKRGLSQMRYMKTMLEGAGIDLYPMDLQGPVDMAHLFLGNEFFYAVYDDPEAVHKALALSVACATYAMEKCFEIIRPGDHVCHYNDLVLPASHPIKISEDTSTLISAAHLEEYMQPYTEQLLARFGGGYIHYCGDNRHLLEIVPRLKNNIGLNFGNPERHNPKQVLETLGKTGMCYYGAFPGLTNEQQAALARREDGSYNQFLTCTCTVNEQLQVIDRFRSFVAAAKG